MTKSPLVLALAGLFAVAGPAFGATDADFKKADANGDGQVSLEEGQAVHKDWTQTAFNELDTDGNGSLSKDEYMAYSGKDQM